MRRSNCMQKNPALLIGSTLVCNVDASFLFGGVFHGLQTHPRNHRVCNRPYITPRHTTWRNMLIWAPNTEDSWSILNILGTPTHPIRIYSLPSYHVSLSRFDRIPHEFVRKAGWSLAPWVYLEWPQWLSTHLVRWSFGVMDWAMVFDVNPRFFRWLLSNLVFVS